MPKRIQFEGVTHEFPDDFSDDEIRSALEQKPAVTPKIQEAPSMGSRFYENTVGALKGMADQYANTPGTNPIARAAGAFVVDPMIGMVKRTMESKAPGSLKVLDTIGSIFIPENSSKDLVAGNYQAALGGLGGNTAMLLAPGAAMKGLRAAPNTLRSLGNAVKNPAAAIEGSLPQRGTMQGTVAYAQKKGFPTTVGERTGSPMLQSAERMAEMTPGAAGTATDFFMGRNAEIMGEGSRLKQGVGKPKTVVNGAGNIEIDKTAAADAVLDRIEGRTTDLKAYKDKKYGAVEEAIERNRSKLQAEQDAAYAAKVKETEKFNNAEMAYVNKRRQLAANAGQNPDGIPMPKLKELPKEPAPVIGAEVNLKPIQDKLRGLYEELSQNMPTTQKDASPGYTRLKSIVEEKRSSKSATELDRDLSEIKRVLRSEQKDYAATQSGRYAAATIDAIEGELQGAVEKAGGKPAVQNLLSARKGVKEMHTALDALEQVLPKADGPAANAPANLFNRLTEAGDTQFPKLEEIHRIAPRAVKDLGATYVEGLLQKITGEAGQADLSAARTAYNRLGPRTKKLLLGEVAPEFDEFIRYAPDLIRNINKSGSGYAMQASKLINPGVAVLGFLAGGAEGIGLAAAGLGGANAMAKFLFRKGNPTLLMDAMKYPPNSSGGQMAMKRLSLAAEKDPAIAAWVANQNSGGSQNRP